MVLPQVFTVISLWSIFPTSAEEGFRGVVLLEEVRATGGRLCEFITPCHAQFTVSTLTVYDTKPGNGAPHSQPGLFISIKEVKTVPNRHAHMPD